MSVNKQAESGIPDVTAQRQLSPHEEDMLAAGKKRWLPRIFQSYGTPIPELMASPLKTGLIFGAPIGIIGAGLGSAIGGKNHSTAGALIGGLGAGGLAALAAGMDRAAKNEGLEELMRRMPEGASKRDLLADPQYQSDFLGWDNNKIVATARARYYRPTERFSKRTFDMADARARYNERHKSSSVNKDVSMSQSEKQALSPSSQILLNYLLRTGILGGAIGGAGGAITSKNKLRGMARGMLMGAGTGLGIGAGIPAGAGLGGGAYLGLGGNPRSYQGMQNLGNAATLGAGTLGTLGGIGGYSGGKALADALVGPAEDEDGEIKKEHKKAAQAILDNKALTLSEKMAAYKNLLVKQADPLASPTMASSIPPMAGPAMSAPADFDPSNMKMPVSPTTGQPMNAPDVAGPPPSPKNPGFFNSLWEGLSSPTAFTGPPSNKPAPVAPKNNGKDYEFLKHLVGYDSPDRGPGSPGIKRDSTLYTHLGKPILDFGSAATSGTKNLVKGIGNYLRPEAPPPPGLLEQLKPYAPYAAVGGAGLGALALADYLSRSKKKRRPEPREEEYDMPKAASVNWYALTKAANNPMEKQAISNYLRLMARLQRMGRGIIGSSSGLKPAAGLGTLAGWQSLGDSVAKSRLGQTVGGGLNTAYQKLRGLNGGGMGQWIDELGNVSTPTMLLTGYGAGAATKDLFNAGASGVRGLGGLLAGKDPSMLQQIMKSKYTPYAAAGLGAAGILGGAAYMGNRAGKNEAKKKKKPEGEKAANLGLGAGVGAGLGGLAGGLYGALAPGHEEDPVSGRRRRRSRLMGALRGLAGGAAVGGLGGAAVGHFAGPNIEKVLGDFLAKKQQGADAAQTGLRTDTTMQADPVEAAKAEAAKAPAPTTGGVQLPPQNPPTANATMGASIPPAPGLTNEMPPAPQANPMPSPSPAAGMGQGPTTFNATMGGMPAQRPMM